MLEDWKIVLIILAITVFILFVMVFNCKNKKFRWIRCPDWFPQQLKGGQTFANLEENDILTIMFTDKDFVSHEVMAKVKDVEKDSVNLIFTLLDSSKKILNVPKHWIDSAYSNLKIHPKNVTPKAIDDLLFIENVEFSPSPSPSPPTPLAASPVTSLPPSPARPLRHRAATVTLPVATSPLAPPSATSPSSPP